MVCGASSDVLHPAAGGAGAGGGGGVGGDLFCAKEEREVHRIKTDPKRIRFGSVFLKIAEEKSTALLFF